MKKPNKKKYKKCYVESFVRNYDKNSSCCWNGIISVEAKKNSNKIHIQITSDKKTTNTTIS